MSASSTWSFRLFRGGAKKDPPGARGAPHCNEETRSEIAAEVEEAVGADRTLARRVSEGDRSARDELVDRIFPRVLTVCRRLTASAADAEDAAQVAMIDILQSIGRYEGRGRLESFCDRVASRAAMRQLHGRARPHVALVPETLPADVDDRRAADDVSRGVAHYLAELTPPLREVLVLRHVLDHSIDEIAQLTGVSPNTVKDRLLRAREAIRKHIRRDAAIGPRGDSR